MAWPMLADELQAFLNKLMERPLSDDSWLVMADRLEEYGDPRAEAVRAWVAFKNTAKILSSAPLPPWEELRLPIDHNRSYASALELVAQLAALAKLPFRAGLTPLQHVAEFPWAQRCFAWYVLSALHIDITYPGLEAGLQAETAHVDTLFKRAVALRAMRALGSKAYDALSAIAQRRVVQHHVLSAIERLPLRIEDALIQAATYDELGPGHHTARCFLTGLTHTVRRGRTRQANRLRLALKRLYNVPVRTMKSQPQGASC